MTLDPVSSLILDEAGPLTGRVLVLDDVAGALTRSVADAGVEVRTWCDDLRDLAVRFRTFTAGGVIFSTVPIADVNGYRARQSVVLLDEAKMSEQFRLLRRDVAPDTPEAAEAEPAAEPLIVAPESIRVRVYNGAGVTGLIMTKLDGTARGGVLVAAAERFGLPIHAIGVGEQATDLRPFDARAVARAIAGLPPE